MWIWASSAGRTVGCSFSRSSSETAKMRMLRIGLRILETKKSIGFRSQDFENRLFLEERGLES